MSHLNTNLIVKRCICFVVNEPKFLSSYFMLVEHPKEEIYISGIIFLWNGFFIIPNETIWCLFPNLLSVRSLYSILLSKYRWSFAVYALLQMWFQSTLVLSCSHIYVLLLFILFLYIYNPNIKDKILIVLQNKFKWKVIFDTIKT